MCTITVSLLDFYSRRKGTFIDFTYYLQDCHPIQSPGIGWEMVRNSDALQFAQETTYFWYWHRSLGQFDGFHIPPQPTTLTLSIKLHKGNATRPTKSHSLTYGYPFSHEVDWGILEHFSLCTHILYCMKHAISKRSLVNSNRSFWGSYDCLVHHQSEDSCVY